MNDLQKREEKLIHTPIHKNAIELIQSNIEDYSILLVHEAKFETIKDGADEVQSNHVKNAINNISKNKYKNWGRELLKIVGGTLFGVFIPGFISSLTPINIRLLIIYTILGFAGMLFVFIGIFDKKNI
jgi:vacuolar-type H+-ATPase subunit F/Vma7